MLFFIKDSKSNSNLACKTLRASSLASLSSLWAFYDPVSEGSFGGISFYPFSFLILIILIK